MKRIILLTTFIISIIGSVSAQKLTEPLHLGSLVGGDDPSEFLLHMVMERSEDLLKENPEGKLIVRICSSDEFSTAYIKAPRNPKLASAYNLFAQRIIVPYEKMFISNSPKCWRSYVYNQYWFVPSENTLEYDEIFPVNSIEYKDFIVGEYNYNSNKEKLKNIKVLDDYFAESIAEFIAELKNNQKTKGFIVHNSKNKRMKNNIGKVYEALKNENINLQRVRIVNRVRLDSDESLKLKPVKDEKEFFPSLEVITINQ